MGINIGYAIYDLFVCNIFNILYIVTCNMNGNQLMPYTSNIYIICYCQWPFQDPKMEVLYHIRPYFVGIFPYIGLI